jgi:DNA modification methylase
MSSKVDYSEPAAEWVEIDSIIPWPDNPKKPTRAQISRLAKLIDQLGFGAPIVARKSDRMIAIGHTRRLAAKKLGHEKVPCRFLDLTDDQLAALAIADNRTAQDQPWLQDNLREQLKELDKKFDPLMLGFTEKEVERFLNRAALPPVPIEDDGDLPFDEPTSEIDEPGEIEGLERAPEDIEVQTGDLWKVGPHRLLIGDCKSRDSVRRLFGKAKADMLFTDPPYGVDFKQADREKNAILGDLSQAEFPVSMDLAIQLALVQDARIYICGGSSNFSMVVALFDHHLRMWPHLILWVKENFVMRRNGYHSRFEIVYHGWMGKGGGPDFWYGDRKQDDVWQVERVPSAQKIHPTEKPPGLAEKAASNHCKPGGIVYDPFSGSWSTAIGAHRAGRVCYGMEKDPKFAKPAILRLAEIVGARPEKERQ